jgi:hypothetical protein
VWEQSTRLSSAAFTTDLTVKVGVVTFKEVTFTLLHLVDDLSLTHVTVSGEVAIDLLRTCDAYDLRMHAEEAGGSMAGVGPSPVLPLPAAAACFPCVASVGGNTDVQH